MDLKGVIIFQCIMFISRTSFLVSTTFSGCTLILTRPPNTLHFHNVSFSSRHYFLVYATSFMFTLHYSWPHHTLHINSLFSTFTSLSWQYCYFLSNLCHSLDAGSVYVFHEYFTDLTFMIFCFHNKGNS